LAMKDSGWRACYLHTSKPAARNCARCGRPICFECMEVSGDETTCAPCVELESTDKDQDSHLEGELLIPRPPETRTSSSFVIGEVTVHSDGTVDLPEPSMAEEPAISPEREFGKHILGTSDSETDEAIITSEPKTPKEELPKAEAPIDILKQNPPDLDRAAVLVSPRLGAACAPIEAEEPGKDHARLEKSEKGHKEDIAKKPRRQSKQKPVRDKLNSRARKSISKYFSVKFPADGSARQLLAALPYGLLGGTAVYAFWLILALIRRQWVQTAVLTAGVAVPWAIFKGSTRKKRLGTNIYSESPRALWMATLAVPIMVILFIVAEAIAFVVVYRGSDFRNPFHDFVQAYFGTLGIIQIVVGFVIAFFLPYLLKKGEGKAVNFPARGKKTEP